MAAAIAAAAEERGWEVVAETYDLTQIADFGPIVNEFSRADVDIVLGTQYPNDSLLFTQAIELQSWRPAHGFVFIAGQQASPVFRAAVESSADGFLVAAYMPAEAACPEHEELRQAFEDEVGIPLQNHLGVGPSAIQVIVDALERTGSTDRAVLRDAIAGSSLSMCDGFMLPGSVGSTTAEQRRMDAGGAAVPPGGVDVAAWPSTVLATRHPDPPCGCGPAHPGSDHDFTILSGLLISALSPHRHRIHPDDPCADIVNMAYSVRGRRMYHHDLVSEGLPLVAAVTVARSQRASAGCCSRS